MLAAAFSYAVPDELWTGLDLLDRDAVEMSEDGEGEQEKEKESENEKEEFKHAILKGLLAQKRVRSSFAIPNADETWPSACFAEVVFPPPEV